jgi:integrase
VLSTEAWFWVAFAIETGLRQEEQFSLRWDHIDLENAVLTLPMPKGGRTRHVPLSEGAKAILRSFGSFAISPYAFPSVRDSLKPLSPHSFLRNVYRPALRRAGIVGANWHTLRHTAASRRIMAGVDVVSVKEILGHRDIETTMRYAHLSPAHLKEGVNKGSLGFSLLQTWNRDLNRDQEILSKMQNLQHIDFLVRPEGLEPPTLGSEVRCSIH